MTRALAILSSDTTGGFWLSELTHPYWHLHEAGIEVDIATPSGPGASFNAFSDPVHPQSTEPGDLVSIGFLNWPGAAERLARAARLADVDAADYDGFWIVGGTGAVYDLHANPELDRLVGDFWAAGKPLAAICHGVIGLATTVADGQPVVAGRALTAYSVAEDQLLERYVNNGEPFLPSYPQAVLEQAGALYEASEPGAVRIARSSDGRILTGQNQQSATAFGLALAELLRST